MLEILQFCLSGFWVFVGSVILFGVIGNLLLSFYFGTIAVFAEVAVYRKKRSP